MRNQPILYAEDELDDAFFMERAFQQASIANPLILVTDGQEAIDYCAGEGRFQNRNEHPLPCLVLLDLNMPRKTGLEVLSWIRTQSCICTLPVIVVTSSNQEADIHRAYVHGANSYLVKPAKADELTVMVKAIRDFWLFQNCMAKELVAKDQKMARA